MCICFSFCFNLRGGRGFVVCCSDVISPVIIMQVILPLSEFSSVMYHLYPIYGKVKNGRISYISQIKKKILNKKERKNKKRKYFLLPHFPMTQTPCCCNNFEIWLGNVSIDETTIMFFPNRIKFSLLLPPKCCFNGHVSRMTNSGVKARSDVTGMAA